MSAGMGIPGIPSSSPRPEIDTSKPHPARVYDYLLGGKDHYAVDKEVGNKLPEEAKLSGRVNRAFMRRAAAWAAAQGIDQFLDIGTGIPTAPNLHQIVQETNPAGRIVYVDNDPIVLRHAEALLVSTPEGATHYVQADAREPETILGHAGTFLDFDRPVALFVIALMHFFEDEQDPVGITRTLVGALAPGSLLVLSHGTYDFHPRELTDRIVGAYSGGGITMRARTRAEVEPFFAGLQMEEPGLVMAGDWYRDTPAPPYQLGGVYAGVARVV